MAKQTINIGASPNDGTGTPLRTSFDYCNLNFTELYTAVGPSGNNIVCPGSATITGDLTVDTSTLKVDSANNTVGIGNATPPVGASNTDIGLALGAAGTVRSVLLGMQNCFGRIRERDAVNNLAITTNIGATGTLDDNTRSSWKIRIGSGNDNYALQRAAIGSSTFQDLMSIGSGGVCVWSDGAGGTRMTLDANGLGVGVSPTEKLSVLGASTVYGDARFNVSLFDPTSATAGTGSGIAFSGYTNGVTVGSTFAQIKGIKENSTAGNIAGAFVVSTLPNGGAPAERMRIDSSGNVGIGVTPSAISNVIRLEIGGALSTNLTLRSSSANASARNWMVGSNVNAFGDFVIRQGNSQGAEPNSGTDRLVLDVSGNLLVGKSSAVATAVGIQFQPAGNSYHTLAASTNADTTLLVYSTGAAAYRFYVGMAGTVFATNTTISAISDARLKENVQDLDVGLDAILALKPRKFDWKEGKGKNIKGDRGFIAQEFETVFPNLIDEWADPAPEGEAPYKSVRQDLIPVLVKAIQELTARVQTLEAK